MKSLLYVIVLIIVCASCHKEVSQQEKFSAFLNTVPDLKFPFQTNSNEELQTKFGVDTTYKAFINESANEVYGKFPINDSVYGVVFLVAGDIVFPLLTTYNERGKNIKNLESFFVEMDCVLTKDLDWETGHNLNAFNDLLYGGFGVHEYEESIILFWINFKESEKFLSEDLKRILEIIHDHEHIEFSIVD